MTPQERSGIAAYLSQIAHLATDALDGLAAGRDVMLGDVDTLHTKAGELLELVVELKRKPTEVAFVGANVDLSAIEQRDAAADKAANLAMAEQQNARVDHAEQRRAG